MSRDPALVVLGATGYTGRLIAHELASDPEARSDGFVVAGRDPERLKRLAAELGGGATPRVADVTEPGSLRRLIRPGDAVINCAGPFEELGEPVVRACVEAGAHYVDTTGEQPFMRAMHAGYHDAAMAADVSVVNGMAFEYALGDCAVAITAASLPEPLRAVDVIYAWNGTASSTGTRRTSVGILGRRAWRLEDGHWRRGPLGARRRAVTLASGRALHAITFGTGEVVTVPRHLEVETVRGWLVVGRVAARLAPFLAPALPVAVPLLRPVIEGLAARADDPTADDRAASRFTIRVELEGADGATRAAEVRGRDPYGITAAIAIAGARRARTPGAPRGVLAPAQLVEPGPFLDALASRGVALVPDG